MPLYWRLSLCCLAVQLSSCSKSEAPGPTSTGTPQASTAAPQAEVHVAASAAVPKEKPSPGPAPGTASVVFSGDIAKELNGPIVTCGYTRLDGRSQGGTWAIHTEDFDFQIIALTDEELANPSVILNAKRPAPISYVYKRRGGKIRAASDRTVAEIDVDLQNVVGKQTVHVKGTLTCPPR